jgi:hypothetical protein
VLGPETLPRIVAFGLIAGHNAFLKTVTNQLDFLVFASSIVDLTFSFLLPSSSSSSSSPTHLTLSIELVRGIRALRALRLLRLASKLRIMRNMLFLLGSIRSPCVYVCACLCCVYVLVCLV